MYQTVNSPLVRKEQEQAAGIGVSILQKRSIGTVSDTSVSIHIGILIFDNTNATFLNV